MNEIKRALVEELHKPARIRFPRRAVQVRGIDETWQADLVEMIPYARENKGFKYLLTVIDIMSKFAYARPLKSKTGSAVASAFKSILAEGKNPRNLHVDRGTEFYNATCKSLFAEYGINMYSTHSVMKASIVERFNRTLKSKMWKLFSLQGNYAWVDHLERLISEYNDTKHRTIGMKPNNVSRANEAEVLERFKPIDTPLKPAKFKVGDKVRISKSKHVFEKGYTPNWTTEVFTITQVVPSRPRTYKLKDYQDQPIAGGFYEYEIAKAKHPDIYLVEKVLRRRGNRLYVKWLGFDATHNSWISQDDL